MAISSAVWVEGVLGLNVQDGEATARVELRSPIAAFASLGSSEPWPSLALSTPADLRDTPAIDEFRTPPASVETTPPLPDRNPIVVQSPAKAKMAIEPAPYVGPAAPTNKLHAITPYAETSLPIPDRKPVLGQSTAKPKMANPTYVEGGATADEPVPPSAAKTSLSDRRPVFVRPPTKSRVVLRGSPIPPSQDGQKWFDSRYK